MAFHLDPKTKMPRKLADIPPEIVSMCVDLLALEYEETSDPSDLLSCRSVMKGAFFDRATYHVFRDISLVQQGVELNDQASLLERARYALSVLVNRTELPNSTSDHRNRRMQYAHFNTSDHDNMRSFVSSCSRLLQKLKGVQDFCMSLPPVRPEQPGFYIMRSLAADVAVFFQMSTALRKIQLIGLRSFALSSLLNWHILEHLEELSLIETACLVERLPQSTLYTRPFLPSLTSFTCHKSDDAAVQLAAVFPPVFSGLTYLAVPLLSGDKPRSWAIMLQAATTLERLHIRGIQLEEEFDDDEDEYEDEDDYYYGYEDDMAEAKARRRKIRNEIKKSNALPVPLHIIDLGLLVSLRSLEITSFTDTDSDEDGEHEPRLLSITTLFQNTSVPTRLKDIHLDLLWGQTIQAESDEDVLQDDAGCQWSDLDKILAGGNFPSLNKLSFLLRFSDSHCEYVDVYSPRGPLDDLDEDMYLDEAFADRMQRDNEPFLDTLFPKLKGKGVSIEFQFRPCSPFWTG